MTAYFIVRAKLVDAALKNDFDRWYQKEHLPDALRGFNARRAWRGWSTVDPAVDYAYYELDGGAKAHAIQGSDAFKRLVAQFGSASGNKVTRSRDVVEVI